MIISKTPFRISFFGGGTDHPEYYNKFGGNVIGTTIDKYCYISARYLPQNFLHKHRISWSLNEDVHKVRDIKHPTAKAIIKYLKINKGLEIYHSADLPGQTGIGSSSSFCVGLLNSLNTLLKKNSLSKEKLSRLSIFLEQKIMKESVGSQDSVWASYGGFNKISFSKKSIKVSKLKISKKNINKLESNIILFNTLLPRYSSDVEKVKIKSLNKKIDFYHEMNSYVQRCDNILKSQNSIDDLGFLFNDYWQLKKKLSSTVVNNYLEEIYNVAIKNGAYGGKILGAGGGGYYMFYCPINKQKKLIRSLSKLNSLKVKFSNTGSKIIFKNTK